MKCPFCGNTNPDEFAIHSEIRVWPDVIYNYACSCGAQGPDADSEAQAVYLFAHDENGEVREW